MLKEKENDISVGEIDKMTRNLSTEQKALSGIVKETLNEFKNHISNGETSFDEKLILKNLEDNLNVKNPGVDEYLIIGSFSLMLGIGYDEYPKKATSKRSYENIHSYIFENKKVLEKWLDIIEKFKVSDINKLKDILIKGTDEPCKEINGNNLHYNLEKIIEKTIIDIKYSKEVVDLLNESKNPTYKTILKVNNMLYQNAEWVGDDAINRVVKLINSESWSDAINKSKEVFTKSKFALVLYDAILTNKEKIENSSGNDVCTINDFVDAIMNHENYMDDYWKQWEDKWVEKHKTTPNEEIEETKEENKNFEPSEKIAEGEFQSLMIKDPARCLFNVLEDYNKVKLTNDNFLELVEKLINDESGYGSDILKYIKSALNTSETFTKGLFDIDVEVLKTNTNVIIQKIKADYKSKAESVCQEIPEEFKINDKVNSVISELILKSFDEKQYLLTQLFAPGIKTYQHLMQMLNMIEGAQVKGLLGHQEYAKLYNLVNNNWKSILTDGLKLDVLHVELSYYMAVEKLLEKIE